MLPDAGRGAQVVINSRDVMEHPWHLHGEWQQLSLFPFFLFLCFSSLLDQILLP